MNASRAASWYAAARPLLIQLQASRCKLQASCCPAPPPVFAPSNQAFNAAVFSGIVTREQLQVGGQPACE